MTLIPEGVHVPTEVAAMLSKILSTVRPVLNADARRGGYKLDARLVAILDELDLARQKIARRNGTSSAHDRHIDEPFEIKKRMISTMEAARRLNIGETAVRGRLRRGSLAGEQTVPGAPWRVYEDAVERERKTCH